MLKNIIIAGTFDVLHEGHKALFKKALSDGKALMVGISSDSFAKVRKGRTVSPFKERKRAIELFLGEDLQRAKFFKLEDEFGNSTTSGEADGIVVSPETEPVADRINAVRKRHGLFPLKILLVPVIRGIDEKRISSTRIIAGEIDARGMAPGKRRGPEKEKRFITKQAKGFQMKKGQIFTIDFMVSIVVFIIVLITIISTWYFIDLHIKEVESRRDMHSVSLSVSDALVRSGGYPLDWNSTNVQSIGLAKEEYVLDLQKIISLMGMDYDSARSIMRLGNYHLFMYITDLNGYNVSTGVLRSPVVYFCNQQRDIASKLDTSGLVWDMYQADGPDESAAHGERYYYLASVYGFTPERMFNYTVLNLSMYKTLILEEPNVKNTSINITGIQDFLNNGGVVLVKSQQAAGYNVIDYNFQVHSEGPAGPFSGKISALDPIIVNATVGETVTFPTSSWRYYSTASDSQITNVVQDSADPSKCLICRWGYGRGRIYYVEDFVGTVNGGPTSLGERLNVIGWQTKFGIPPANTIDVVAVNRVAVLEGIFRQPVAVHIFIWRSSA